MNNELVKITKDKEGKISQENISSVKSRNLELPSDSELKEAITAIERGS
jgi:hypothetical protein